MDESTKSNRVHYHRPLTTFAAFSGAAAMQVIDLDRSSQKNEKKRERFHGEHWSCDGSNMMIKTPTNIITCTCTLAICKHKNLLHE